MNQAAALRLEGTLDVARVPKLLKNLPQQPGATLDVSAVSRCDSAGLALLLELRRRAGGKLTLQGANAQLTNLIDFYQLQPLLA